MLGKSNVWIRGFIGYVNHFNDIYNSNGSIYLKNPMTNETDKIVYADGDQNFFYSSDQTKLNAQLIITDENVYGRID